MADGTSQIADNAAMILNGGTFDLVIRIMGSAGILFAVFLVAQAHRNTLVGLGLFRERAVATSGRALARLALETLLELGGAVTDVSDVTEPPALTAATYR